MRSILCEGGPSLNAALLAAGLVDELFLTTVAQARGRRRGAHDHRQRAASERGAGVGEPVDARLRSLLECDGELFARYAVAT